jgi:hypothetical protein
MSVRSVFRSSIFQFLGVSPVPSASCVVSPRPWPVRKCGARAVALQLFHLTLDRRLAPATRGKQPIFSTFSIPETLALNKNALFVPQTQMSLQPAGFKFGSFDYFCSQAPLSICPLVGNQVEPVCYARNVEIAGTLIFEPGTSENDLFNLQQRCLFTLLHSL